MLDKDIIYFKQLEQDRDMYNTIQIEFNSNRSIIT